MEDLDIENDDGVRLELCIEENGSLWISTDGDFELSIDNAFKLLDSLKFFLGEE